MLISTYRAYEIVSRILMLIGIHKPVTPLAFMHVVHRIYYVSVLCFAKLLLLLVYVFTDFTHRCV